MNSQQEKKHYSSNPNETQEEIQAKIDAFKAQMADQLLSTSLDVTFNFNCWRCGENHSFTSHEKKDYPIILTINPSDIIRK
jgi:hypothetical protein